MENVHSLRTEAERLGVSPAALSEAVKKNRQCAGLDVIERARFDRTGRCIGFVPAPDPDQFYRNGPPGPVPLTKAELDAVNSGVLTIEEAEAKARAREEVPVEEDTPNGATAQTVAHPLVVPPPARQTTADLVADDEPDEEFEEDPYDEAAAWLAELSEADRRAFIREYGADVIASERSPSMLGSTPVATVPEETPEAAAERVRAALEAMDPDALAEILGPKVEARITERAYEIANDVLESEGLEPISEVQIDGESVYKNGESITERAVDAVADAVDGAGEVVAAAIDTVDSAPGILTSAFGAFAEGVIGVVTLGLVGGDDDEATPAYSETVEVKGSAEGDVDSDEEADELAEAA